MSDIFATIVLYVILTLVIRLIFMFILDDKGIRIKIPKSKRYLGKITPIYELKQSEFDSDYAIHKWELKWGEDSECGWNYFLLLICPIPINLIIYNYKWVGLIWVQKEYEHISSLKHEYELRDKKLKQQLKKSEKAEMKKLSKIDKLNKTFNENYC